MSVVSNGGLWNSGTYIPFLCNITAVSQGQTTTITTAVNHGFIVGNQVQFVIPPQWGIRQLNNLKGYILSITSDTITVNIDSSNFDAFITPTVVLPLVVDQPQVIPIGGENVGYTSANVLNPALKIPGAFRNTYP